jgi:hypothetical protein
MLLEEVVHKVESRLASLGQRLWQDPQALFQDQVDRLRAELDSQRALLTRQQKELADARDRLRDNENAVGSLPFKIKLFFRRGHSTEAWQLALRLDEARQQLAQDQVAVPRLEQVCWCLRFRLRQLQRRLVLAHKQMPPR